MLDAAIQLRSYQAKANRKRLAIKPYPKEWEQKVTLKDGQAAVLRPIRPEDERAHQEFDQSLTKEDRYKRFFGELPEFNHEQLAKMTQIDYDREMAFIVSAPHKSAYRTLGVSRVLMDPDNLSAEFAVVVRFSSPSSSVIVCTYPGAELYNCTIRPPNSRRARARRVVDTGLRKQNFG